MATAEYHRDWYQKNKESVSLRKGRRNKKWSVFLRHISDEIKLILGCTKCGYAQHPRALDFHHRDRNNKSFEVSTAVGQCFGLIKFLKEISKCDVLCANCHRIETHKERVFVRNSDSGSLRASEA